MNELQGQQVSQLLLDIYVGENYVINQEALDQLSRLQVTPLSLRMHPEVMDQVMTFEDFPAATFVTRILAGFRINYLRALQGKKDATPTKARATEYYNLVCIQMGHLVDAVVRYGHLAEDEVTRYLDADDLWLKRYGATLLEAFPNIGDKEIDRIISSMRRGDLHSTSNPLAQALAECLDQRTALYARICNEFEAGNVNLKAGILQAIAATKRDLPLVAQDMILATAMQFGPNCDDNLHNLSVIALATCRQRKQEVIAYLTQCLKSKTWPIRGNAAMSLAMLGVEGDELIDKISEMIFDTEGNDWSVRSAALEALQLLGASAARTIPALLRLAHQSEEVQDFHGYPCTNQLLAVAFGAIGDARPEVIEVLCKLVTKQGYISAFPAVRALAQLGTGSENVVLVVKTYLFGPEMPADDADSANMLIDALIAIAGYQHPVNAQFLAHLRSSPFEEVRAIVHARQRALRV